MGRSLVITENLNKKLDESGSFNLKVPTDAARKGSGDSASFSWTEPIVIVDTTKGAANFNPETDQIAVQFRVPANTPDSENAGRAGTWWFNVNVDAMSNDSHDEHKTSIINAARLRQLATAAGFEVNVGDDLFAIFEPAGQGEQSPIAGATVTVKLTDKPKKNKETGEFDGRRQDPVAFYPSVG